MNENVQKFRGLSALFIGNKQERAGKHLPLPQGFIWDPDSTLVVWAGEVSSTYSQETNCENKVLEVILALLKVEQESRCFGTVSETRRTQH